jgi:hypothetical protein
MDHLTINKVYLDIEGVEVEFDIKLLTNDGILGVILDGPLHGYELRLDCDTFESLSGNRYHHTR